MIFSNSPNSPSEQRWLMVYSEQAFMREKKTFEKNFKTKEAALMQVI
jgi:hypothetical protein